MIKDIIHSIKLTYHLFAPKRIFIKKFSNGMGDNLLLTCSIEYLKKKHPEKKIIVESKKWMELFYNHPHIDWITDKHFSTTKRHVKLKYHIDEKTQKSIYKQIAEKIGNPEIHYPKLYLTREETNNMESALPILKPPIKRIAFCPFGKRGYSANRKEWGQDHFQVLINNTKNRIQWIQIGLKEDALLENAHDFRGLPIRKSAALIRLSDLFLGLEGGLMHLAKSVEKDSVIIYGGFIKPEISGYPNNINIVKQVDCSPCFRSDKPLSDCESMKCMELITPEEVEKRIMNYFNAQTR